MNGTRPAKWRCACGGCGCGCCEGIDVSTPQTTANRPGLSALRYRIGTHGRFLESMKARLSGHWLDRSRDGVADAESLPSRPLAALRLRDDSDPAIAILDAWATVADVLTFYQERIANEGYLRTATELRSMFELSRLVGYRPRPGVASSVYLAYTIDANTPQEIVVPKGARAQTVPGQDEQPQTFETSLDLKARAAWNRLGLRKAEPQQWEEIERSSLLYLAGTQTRLKVGDPLLIDRGDQPVAVPAPYRVRAIEVSADDDRTAVRIEPWQGSRPVVAASAPAVTSIEERIRRLVEPPSSPRANALQLPRSLKTSFEATGDAGLRVLGAVAPALKSTLAPALAGYEAAAPPQPIRVWALRLKAGLFGRTFPRRSKTQTALVKGSERETTSKTLDDGEWPIVISAAGAGTPVVAREAPDTLYLDTAHDAIAPDSWVFVDASAVPRRENSMVEPTQPLLVAAVKAVLPKLSRADYGGSGDTTGLVLGSDWIKFLVENQSQISKKSAGQAKLDDYDFQLVRRSAVYALSEALTLAERPIQAPLCSGIRPTVNGPMTASPDPIELDGLYAGLEPGRFVIVSGERSDVGATRGVFASEPVMITSVVHDVRAAGSSRGPWTQEAEAARRRALDEGGGGGPQLPPLPPQLPGDKTHTFVWFDKPLAYCYRREKLAILGNVVKATHGETRQETLGNGDGSKPLQRFELKQSPLTHLAASTAAGAESTLQVYVNDVRWHEVHGVVDRSPTDRIYVVQTDDKGKTTVQFSNGREGARLPTGIGNVKATYRNGIGRPGNVGPDKIQQLATRPLGVKEVTNPLRASGGADREGRDQLRRNAPLAVKALDRLVSTPDYADFACTFAGIGKADAQEISDGRRSVVHLSVAGIDDIPIDSDSDLLIHLRRALREVGDPFQPVVVEPRELRLLIVSAKLRIDPDYLWEPVVTQVRDALLEAFGFNRRELAQGVASSEVLSVMQSVRGVSLVDLDAFGAIDTVTADNGTLRPRTPSEIAAGVAEVVAAGVAPAVQARRARRSLDGTTVLPAQLALLSREVTDTLVLNQLV